jgi:ubiquitin carboxyl-terminal hydrolase L3
MWPIFALEYQYPTQSFPHNAQLLPKTLNSSKYHCQIAVFSELLCKVTKKWDKEMSLDLTPLSNDPESLKEFAVNIGLEESSFDFAEVFSFDEEMLEMVPRPVLSTIFLYPIGDSKSPLEKRHSEPQELGESVPWYTYQNVANACGTIAVLHSILNNLSVLQIKENSWLAKFIADSANESWKKRGKRIEGSNDLLVMHEDAAEDDSTPVLESSGWNHFITFVIKDGNLWELDGRKRGPICHGPCEDLLRGTLSVMTADFFPHVDDIMKVSLCALCGK